MNKESFIVKVSNIIEVFEDIMSARNYLLGLGFKNYKNGDFLFKDCNGNTAIIGYRKIK